MATRPGLSPKWSRRARTLVPVATARFSIDLKLNYFGPSLIIRRNEGFARREKRRSALVLLASARITSAGSGACKLGASRRILSRGRRPQSGWNEVADHCRLQSPRSRLRQILYAPLSSLTARWSVACFPANQERAFRSSRTNFAGGTTAAEAFPSWHQLMGMAWRSICGCGSSLRIANCNSPAAVASRTVRCCSSSEVSTPADCLQLEGADRGSYSCGDGGLRPR